MKVRTKLKMMLSMDLTQGPNKVSSSKGVFLILILGVEEFQCPESEIIRHTHLHQAIEAQENKEEGFWDNFIQRAHVRSRGSGFANVLYAANDSIEDGDFPLWEVPCVVGTHLYRIDDLLIHVIGWPRGICRLQDHDEDNAPYIPCTGRQVSLRPPQSAGSHIR